MTDLIDVEKLTHDKLIDIFYNLIEFTKTSCACAIDRNYTNDITNETQSCPLNCCFTAVSMAILMRLYLLNENIYTLEFPKTIIFPRQTTTDILYDENSFFIGITNTIGLLWDAHEDLKYPFTPSGINFALNNERLKNEWFDFNIKLNDGINLISFSEFYKDIEYITHNSFIYVNNNLCYLIDSWRGFIYNTVDCSNKIPYRRDIKIRIYDLETLQNIFDTLTNININLQKEDNDQNEINRLKNIKKYIFTNIFLGPDGIGNDYDYWLINKLKNNIIDEQIIEGFKYKFSLFGGINKYKIKYIKYKQKYIDIK